jgi:hypothetical protein
MIRVRPAIPADAAAIARIHVNYADSLSWERWFFSKTAASTLAIGSTRSALPLTSLDMFPSPKIGRKAEGEG